MTTALSITVCILAIALVVSLAIISVLRKVVRSLNAMLMQKRASSSDIDSTWQEMYTRLFRHSLIFDKANYELLAYDTEFAIVNRSQDGSTIIKTFAFTDEATKETARACADTLFEALTV
jgi:hypothetical protein